VGAFALSPGRAFCCMLRNDVKLCMDSAYCQLGEYDVSIIFV
jgi:hypothetical protein